MDSKKDLDVRLTNDEMDIVSNSSSREDESLISAIQQLSTNERSIAINSKIPQPISKKQIRNNGSPINASTIKQSSSDSLNSLLSNKQVVESVGSDVANETEPDSKPASKTLSQIPKPLTNVISGLKSFESYKSFDSITDKAFISNNQLITKRQLISPLNHRPLEMPVIPNLHLLRNSQFPSFGSPINQTSELRFAKIRSTVHANKRMPALNINQLRRHNSLDTTHKSFNSYQTRFRQTKVFADKSILNNSRLIKESRITNTSSVKSQFTTFSTESRKISTSKSDKSGVAHSSSYSKVIESFSSESGNNQESETSKHEVIKTKSHSNLQRNRPQVKAPSGRIRTPLKSRSNSVPESKALPVIDRGVNRAASDSTPNSSQKGQNTNIGNENSTTNLIDLSQLNQFSQKNVTQFSANESYNSKMMRMFIMDEDNIPVSPKKLLKTPNLKNDSIARQKDKKKNSKEDKSSEKSTFKQYLFETYVNKVPVSAQNSPEKHNTPPNISRPRSSSEHHLSSLLLSEAQKEAINEIKKPINTFNKSSRPWSPHLQ